MSGTRTIGSWEEIDYTKGWMPARPSREAADALEAERQAKFRRA